jgi:hypothetical protein
MELRRGWVRGVASWQARLELRSRVWLRGGLFNVLAIEMKMKMAGKGCSFLFVASWRGGLQIGALVATLRGGMFFFDSWLVFDQCLGFGSLMLHGRQGLAVFVRLYAMKLSQIECGGTSVVVCYRAILEVQCHEVFPSFHVSLTK